MKPNTRTPSPTKPELRDQPRDLLVRAALRLFAKQGFSKTSIREIAELADANVAAISYYFGDKAGLYRAAFFEGCNSPEENISRFSGTQLSLEQALYGLFSTFLEPLADGDMARDCILLHFREMIEPTGLWADEIAQRIEPQHTALVKVLCRHLQLKRADDEVHRLALSVVGLGVHLYVGSDVAQAVAPRLASQPKALTLWADRLVMYAQAMIGAEAQRRVSLKIRLKDAP
jgi:TetR/AcrR family transcriptional regulator, regulator of cefoperazone and chloramphenicol sensitivity